MYDNDYENEQTNSGEGAAQDSGSGEQTYYNSAKDSGSGEQTYYNSAKDSGSEEQNHSYGGNYYNQNNNPYQNQPEKKKKGNGFAKFIIAIVVVLGISLVAAAGFIWLSRVDGDHDDMGFLQQNENGQSSAGSKEEATYDQTKVYEAADGIAVTDVSEIVEQNMPSVVAITSTTVIERGQYYDFYNYYFGGGNDSGKYQQETAGSGIIIKQTEGELLIVTNNHVVEDSDNVKIVFDGMDSKDAVDGQIKGTNPTSDVAVVAVKTSDIPKNANIRVATLGNSDDIKVGNGVIAIGNALGYGQSVTTGIISAKDRNVELDNGTMTLLQTDAAINGGNSGGALLNAKGEVIGINVAKYSSSSSANSASIEGMGFAIPISSVTDTINNLENMKTRQKVDEDKRGYLGINGNDVDEEDALFYNIPQGVIITSVGENSPAAKAGIEEKDIITSFDGQEIKSMSELQKKLEYYAANEKVKVAISKNTGNGYQSKEVTVTLGDSSVLSND